MSKRTASEIEAQVVTALEIGRSMPDIARQFHMDLSTVKRIRKRYGVSLGSARAKLVEQAREEARKAFDPEYIRDQAAILIRDDLAQIHQLRNQLNDLLEAMPEPQDIKECSQVARSLTAVSTALKNTSDLAHKSLGLDRNEVEASEMPMLVISELTSDEVSEMRKRQAEEDEEHSVAEAA